MKIKKHLILLLMGLMGLSLAEAATVYMTDGTTKKGTIVSATAMEIQLNTDHGLEHIHSNRIFRIEYSDAPVAPAKVENPVPPSANDDDEEPVRRIHRARRVHPLYEAVAEPGKTRESFSIDFGLSSALSRVNFSSTGGGSDTNGDAGLLLGAQYLYQTTPRTAWGLNVEFMGRGESSSHNLVPFADTRVSGNSFLLMPVFKFSIIDKGWTRPYFLAGVGLNRTSTIIQSRPDPDTFGWPDTNTFETRDMVNDAHWGLATTARIGIDFLQFDPSFLSLEIGWTGINNDNYRATPDGQFMGLDHVTGNLSLFSIGGRWGWRF